jgi:hypothetical protein
MGFFDFVGDIAREVKGDIGGVARFGMDAFKQTQAIPLSIIGGGFGLANNIGGNLSGGLGKAVGGIGQGLGGLAGGLGGIMQYLPILLIGGGVIFGIVYLKKAMA